MVLKYQELNSGMQLPESRITVRQENINLYAEASRDFNPIHIDPEFARKTELGGTVAHGMLVLAHVSAYMTARFGGDWLTGGSLNVRFKAAARPGDTLTISGKITEIAKNAGYSFIRCDVLCRNQDNEAVITGEAVIKKSLDLTT